MKLKIFFVLKLIFFVSIDLFAYSPASHLMQEYKRVNDITLNCNYNRDVPFSNIFVIPFTHNKEVCLSAEEF